LPVHYIKPFIEIKVGFVICLNFRRSLNGLATDFLALYSHLNNLFWFRFWGNL